MEESTSVAIMKKKEEKLLEKVAKFHGVQAKWWEIKTWHNSKGRKWKVGDGPRFQSGVERMFGLNYLNPWNPLEDSALALELAARYEVLTKHHGKFLETIGKPDVAKLSKEQALRYAIVLTLGELAEHRCLCNNQLCNFNVQVEKTDSSKGQ